MQTDRMRKYQIDYVSSYEPIVVSFTLKIDVKDV
jgi:hypothetical protein